MKKNDFHPANITRGQSGDAGMAMVLILLLLGLYSQNLLYIKIATGCLVAVMAAPILFKYIAVVWLGGSRLLGTYVSKILLSLVFLAIVTPVGLFRRMFGLDSLKLKKFKTGASSVMTSRELQFTREDINKPY